MNNCRGALSVWVRHTSLLMCAVFFHVNIAYPAVEPAGNFWRERKAAAERLSESNVGRASHASPLLLAQLPALDFHALPQAPSVRNLPLSSSELSTSLKPLVRLPNQSLPGWISSVSASKITLKDLYLPSSWKPGDFMVLHIQDAHGNAQAQENIAKTLESLAKVEKNLLLGIEGARGEFNFHPYRSFPDTQVTKEIADYFLKEGFITGPEYVGMSAPQLPAFWGVEDEGHYLAHVQALKDATKLKKDALSDIEKATAKLEGIKDKELNPGLRELDAKMTLHRRGSLGLGEYLKFLAGQPSSRLSSHPAIAHFLSALKLEEALNYDLVEKERTSLTLALSRDVSRADLENLVKASLAYRLGNISHSAFYEYLKDLCAASGVKLGNYPEMDKYIRYVLASEKIRVEDLLSELGEMESRALEASIKTPREMELINQSQDLGLSEKLVKFELSPEEWKSYSAKTAPIDGLPADALKPFEKFNEAAIARNDVLVGNLLKKAEADKSALAVLVAGGFHTDGMMKILKDKKVAYAVLTPRLGKIEGTGSEYLDVFTRDKTPLEKLFTGERIQIAKASPFSLVYLGDSILSGIALVERHFTSLAHLLHGNVMMPAFKAWLEGANFRTVTAITEMDTNDSQAVYLKIDGKIGDRNRISFIDIRKLGESDVLNNAIGVFKFGDQRYSIGQTDLAWYWRFFYRNRDWMLSQGDAIVAYVERTVRKQPWQIAGGAITLGILLMFPEYREWLGGGIAMLGMAGSAGSIQSKRAAADILMKTGISGEIELLQSNIKNSIWRTTDGAYILKIIHAHDFGSQRFINELLYLKENPYPAEMVKVVPEKMAIIFKNAIAGDAEVMIDRMRDATTLDELMPMVRSAGKSLARHHVKKFEIFGWFSPGGNPRPVHLIDFDDPNAVAASSYFDFVSSNLEKRFRALEGAGLTVADERTFMEWMKKWGSKVDAEHQYVLNHGDYNPWNIFVDKTGEVKTVIDGEWIRSAPAVRDVAVAVLRLLDASIGNQLLMKNLNALCGEFIRSYKDEAGALGVDAENLESILPFYMVYDLVTGAWFHRFEIGDHPKSRWLISMARHWMSRDGIDIGHIFNLEAAELTHRNRGGSIEKPLYLAGIFSGVDNESRWIKEPMKWDEKRGIYWRDLGLLPVGEYSYFIDAGGRSHDLDPLVPQDGNNLIMTVKETENEETVQAALDARLRAILQNGQRPLLSLDIDDTLIPYAERAKEPVLFAIIDYLRAGGDIALNTLTQENWVKERILDPLTQILSGEERRSLFHRLHYITQINGSQHEIYMWDGASYRRHEQRAPNKGDGLVALLEMLGERVSLLAAYGDLFIDPRHDGSLAGREEIPLVVNVGESVPVPAGTELFINSNRKGPEATLADIRFITQRLRESSDPTSKNVVPDILDSQGRAITKKLLGVVLAVLSSPIGLGLITLGLAWIWPDYMHHALTGGGLMGMAAMGGIQKVSDNEVTFFPSFLRRAGVWLYRALPDAFVKVDGIDRLPLPSQSYILVGNHPLRGLDAALISLEVFLATGRFPRFITVLPQAYEMDWAGRWLEKSGALLVLKAGEKMGTKAILRELEKPGAVVGIFPSGYPNRIEPLNEWKTGFAWAARMAEVPIVPVAVTYRASLNPYKISFGLPISHLDARGSPKSDKTLLNEVKRFVKSLAASPLFMGLLTLGLLWLFPNYSEWLGGGILGVGMALAAMGSLKKILVNTRNNPIEVTHTEDEAAMAHQAALEVEALLKQNNPLGKKTVIGFATGSTQKFFWEELKRLKREGLDFSNVVAFHLDNYIGLSKDQPEDFRNQLQQLYDALEINDIHFINTDASDLKAECTLYENLIREAGGIDLQILGIGSEGHIAFIEADGLASRVDSRTGVVALAPSTRQNNAKAFGGDAARVPDSGVSMGMGTILEVKKIILLACGKAKAEAVYQALHGPLSPGLPASFLRLHTNVRIIVDKEAYPVTGQFSDPSLSQAQSVLAVGIVSALAAWPAFQQIWPGVGGFLTSGWEWGLAGGVGIFVLRALYVELGVTHIRGGWENGSGHAVLKAFDILPDKEEGTSLLLSTIEEFIHALQQHAPRSMDTIWMASPGIISADGVIELANNLALTGVPLRQELEKRLSARWGRPVTVRLVNDLIPAGIAEQNGSGRFLYLNFGAGLSAADVNGDSVLSLELGNRKHEEETLESRYQTLKKSGQWDEIARLAAGPILAEVVKRGAKEVVVGGGAAKGRLEFQKALNESIGNHIKLRISNIPERERGIRGLALLADAENPSMLSRFDQFIKKIMRRLASSPKVFSISLISAFSAWPAFREIWPALEGSMAQGWLEWLAGVSVMGIILSAAIRQKKKSKGNGLRNLKFKNNPWSVSIRELQTLSLPGQSGDRNLEYSAFLRDPMIVEKISVVVHDLGPYWLKLLDVPRDGGLRRGLKPHQAWSVGKHTLLLMLMALAHAKDGDLTPDEIAEALRFAAIHDALEIITGDSSPFNQEKWAHKAAIEDAALVKLSEELLKHDPTSASDWENLIVSYRKQDTRAARFVKHLDKQAHLVEFLDYSVRFPEHAADFLEINRKGELSQWDYSNSDVSNGGSEFPVIVELNRQLNAARSNEISKLPNPSFTPPAVIQTLLGMVLAILASPLGLGLLTLTAALIWPDYIREVLGSGGMAMAAAGTLEPATGSFITRILQALRPSKVRESILDLGRAGVQFEHPIYSSSVPIAQLRSIRVIAPHHALGEAAVSLPLLLHSLLRTAPGLERIWVETNFPELIEGMDPRVVISPDESRWADPLRPEAVIDLQAMFNKIHRIDDKKLIHDKLTEKLSLLGFNVPEFNETIINRSVPISGLIFVNPFGITNNGGAYLEKSWKTLILRLILNGKSVVLNGGRSENILDQLKSERLSQEILSDLGDSQAAKMFRVFKGDRKQFFDEIKQAESVITIDSSPFHLARLFGVPVVVITTKNSTGWVPEKEDNFRRVEDQQFALDEGIAAEALTKLNDKSHAAPSRLHIAHPPQDFLDAVGHEGPHRFQLMVMDMETPGVPSSPEPGINAIVFTGLRFDPQNFARVSDTLNDLTAYLSMQVDSGMNGSTSRAIVEAIKNAVIWGNKNRSRTHLAVRWRRDENKFIVDVIDQGARPIDFVGRHKPPDGIPDDISPMRIGYSGSIRRFLDQDHFETPLNRFESHQVYDFPLLTRDGRRVGQIVRLIFPARQAAGSKIPSISIPIAAFVIGSVLLNPLAAEAALASASILASPGMTALPELHGLGLGIWVLGAGVLGMAAQKPPKEHPLSPRQIKSALVAIAMEPRLRNIVQELMDGKSIEVVAANNGMTRRELYVNILQYDIFLSEKFTDHFGQTVFVELGPKRVVFENEPPPAKNEDPAPIERKKQAVAAKKDSQGEMVKTIHKLSKESEFYAKSLALFLREPAEFSQAIMKMIESTNPMEIQFLGFEAFRALVKTMPNVGVKLNEIEKLHFAKIVDLIAQKADEANELTMDQALSALAALVNSGWKTRNALKEELWVRIIDSLAGGVVSRPPLQAIAYVKSLGRWKNDPKVLDALKSLEGQDLSQSVHTAIAQALQTSVMDWHKIATAFLVAILGVATTSEAGAWLSAAQSVGWLRMEWLGALVLGMAALGMVWNKLEARVQSRWYAAVLAGVLTMSAFILFDLYDKGSFTFIGRSDDIVHRHLADGLITVGVYFQSRLSDIAHAFIAPVAELILSVLWFGKVHSTTAAKKRPSIWNGFWWGMSATFFIMSLARFWLDVGIMMLGHPGQYYLSAWVSLLINEWRGDILIIQPTLGKTVLTTLLTALVTLVGGWPLWRAYRREARRKALLPANPGRRWNKKAQADSAPVLSSSGEIHESDKAAEKTSMVPDADPASQNKPHLRLVQEQTERMAIASDYASKILYVQAALELGSFQAAMDFLNMIDEDIKTAKKMNKALKNPSQASETELLPVAEWVNDVAELKKKIPEATDIDIFIDAPSNDPDAKRLGDAFKTYAEARELPLDVVFSNFRFPVEELLPPGADSWLAMDGPDSRSNEEFAQGMIFSRIYREGRLLHRAVLPAIPTGKPAVAPKDGSSGHSTGLFDLSLAFDYPAVALVVSVLGGSLAATGVPFIISVLSGLALGIGAIGMVQATEPKIQEHKFRAGGTLLTRAMTEVMRRLWVHKIIRIGPNGWTRRISNWGYEETLLEDINKNLRSDILSEIIAKSRAHPDRTVTVVDWGTGTGKSLKEIRAKLQAKGISNVRLVGFGDQYYEVWHSMPQGITLIWDTSESFFKYFAPGEIDFLFSHYGFAHMREALAGYLLKLSSKMAPGGRIITNIYSNQSIHGLAHSINKEYSLNYLGIPKEYKNPSIQLDKKQGEGNDKIIPLVTEHALYLSQIGQIGFDSVSHRAQEVKKVEAARLAGADAADTAVIAVDPAHASKVELKKVESQFKRMKDSGKAVRVALVGSGLFSNSFTVSSLRLATGIQPMIVERNSQTDILDLDVLYNDIQAADPRLGKFSLVFIADSTLSIKMSWINSMIQQPVISGMEHEIQAALAAVLSQ